MHTRNISPLDLCIQNIGTGVAFDVKLSGNFDSFQVQFDDKTLADWDIIKNGISFLGPNKRYQRVLYFLYEPEKLPEEILTINVTYEDSRKNKHRKTYHLNFKKVESYPQMGDPSLESIADSLLRIEENMSEKNAGTDKE